MPIFRNNSPEQLAALKAKYEEVAAPVNSNSQVDPPDEPPGAPNSGVEISSSALPDIKTIRPTIPAFAFDSPVHLHTLLQPDIKLYDWQFEELMRVAGYPVPGKYSPADKVSYSTQQPFIGTYPCANASGKDMILIALSSVWFMLTGQQNRAIWTSASQIQLKSQTSPHIETLCRLFNQRFGHHIDMVQFHFMCPKLASEIRLFATDTPGRAEGYHPVGRGQMMIGSNEAKSIDPEIWSALLRCFGWSYWMEVSSPGQRRGHFYQSWQHAIKHPAPMVLGHNYSRTVTYLDCPHITPAQVDLITRDIGINHPLARSALFAEFHDLDAHTIIPDGLYASNLAKPPPFQDPDDIGIGLDLAFSTGGDSSEIAVRKGNKLLHTVRTKSDNTNYLVDWVNGELQPWFNLKYTFNGDAGGLGKPILSLLRDKGWEVIYRFNQSPAYNKSFFLNLGAEMWYHLRTMLMRGEVIMPDAPSLRTQLTSRRTSSEPNPQGKVALQDKKEHKRANGGASPDEADAFVLAFFSYKPNQPTAPSRVDPDTVYKPNPVTAEDINTMFMRGKLFTPSQNVSNTARDLGQSFAGIATR